MMIETRNKIIANQELKLRFWDRLKFLLSGIYKHKVVIEFNQHQELKSIFSAFGKYDYELKEEIRFQESGKKKPTCILSFVVIKPTNELESVGEILHLCHHGEYCPNKSLRGYSLTYLLANSQNYKPNTVSERGELKHGFM